MSHKAAARALLLFVIMAGTERASADGRHALEPDDFLRMAAVEAPTCSADGQWIAYTVVTADRDADAQRTAVWMVNWSGSEHVQVTEPLPSASLPRFSPDGKYLAFIGSRTADDHDQLYIIDRRGGEGRKVTHVEGDISDYAWSPDGKQVALVLSGAPEHEPGDAAKSPKPIVITRWRFKDDHTGYLTDVDHPRIYILDIASGKLRALSPDGRFDETRPAWSPDGRRLAYESYHGAEPETSGVTELYIEDLNAGSQPRQLAHYFTATHPSLAFTPDGRRLLHSEGFEPKMSAYAHDRLALVDIDTGKSRLLAEKLDRNVGAPTFGPTADSVSVLVEDDGSQYPATIRLSDGKVDRRVAGPMSATAQCGAGGHVAVLSSSDSEAAEIRAIDGGKLRKLTNHSEPLLDELSLGSVEDVSFQSADGTEIHGMMVKPPNFEPGKRYPTIVWIHGGPVGQDEHALAFESYSPELERQFFAMHGYVVLAINYRGGSGRGPALQRAIFADWGRLEVEDLLAGTAYVVSRGIADPARLGIGGWSYGGILTDYTIATDTRFKAAISGAGSGNQISMYGVDEYALQYTLEVGTPWANESTWLKISYPFFHADRIKTPTLFMGGEKDFNVPISGSEQMYQMLRIQGVPTELVVYPGQHHVFDRPSFIKDKMERFLGWFDRYLKAAP